MVTAVHRPDDARILHRQIRALLDAGHQVTYCAPWTPSEAARRSQGRLQCVSIPRAAGRRRLRAWMATNRAVRALGTDADLILIHDPELIPLVGVIAPAPVVWDVHEDLVASIDDKEYLPRPTRPVVKGMTRALTWYGRQRLHVILAEDGYRAGYGDHPVVPNAAWPPTSVPPPGRDHVVHVGRVSIGRGAETLLDVAERLDGSLHIDVMGDVDDGLVPQFEQAAHSGALAWTGFVPNDEAMQRVNGALAGLCLLRDLPNYRHSRPTKVVEYMARGVPVVTTPNPVAREIVEAYDCGIVVPHDDAAAVVAALERLRDDELRCRLGNNGRRAALCRFDWARDAERFVDQLEAWAR